MGKINEAHGAGGGTGGSTVAFVGILDIFGETRLPGLVLQSVFLCSISRVSFLSFGAVGVDLVDGRGSADPLLAR